MSEYTVLTDGDKRNAPTPLFEGEKVLAFVVFVIVTPGQIVYTVVGL